MSNLFNILCRKVPKSTLLLFNTEKNSNKNSVFEQGDNLNEPLAIIEEKCSLEKEKDSYKQNNVRNEMIVTHGEIVFEKLQ